MIAPEVAETAAPHASAHRGLNLVLLRDLTSG